MEETTGKTVCSAPGCTDPAEVGGKCRLHYARERNGWEDLDTGSHGPLKGRLCRLCGEEFDATDGRQTVCPAHTTCSTPGCTKKSKARGLCPACYSRQWREKNLRRR